MKANLDSLVKIAKQKLTEQERLLATNEMLIQRKRDAIEAIRLEMSSIPIPKSGSFSAYKNRMDGIEAYQYEIREIEGHIDFLLQEQAVIRQNIRLAHMEHEKMKYVCHKEGERLAATARLREIKQLDESTILLHARK